MFTRRIAFVVLGVVAGFVPGRAQTPDPVRDRLTVAVKTFNAAMDRLESEAVAALDAQEAKARATGNKKQVDALAAKRDSVKERIWGDEVPATIRKRANAAKAAADAAYDAAIREYTRQKKDADAAAVEAEFGAFKVLSPFGGSLYLTNRNSGRVAAVADNSAEPGARVFQWDKAGREQQWYVAAAEDGYVVFKNAKSGHYLTAATGNPGGITQEKNATGRDAEGQQWKIVPAPNEPRCYRLINRAGDRVLEVSGGSKGNLAALVAAAPIGPADRKEQFWKFEGEGR